MRLHVVFFINVSGLKTKLWGSPCSFVLAFAAGSAPLIAIWDVLLALMLFLWNSSSFHASDRFSFISCWDSESGTYFRYSPFLYNWKTEEHLHSNMLRTSSSLVCIQVSHLFLRSPSIEGFFFIQFQNIQFLLYFLFSLLLRSFLLTRFAFPATLSIATKTCSCVSFDSYHSVYLSREISVFEPTFIVVR